MIAANSHAGASMPILHVRNFPEDLYERIKRQAAESNRSISAEVITLLQRAISDSSRSQDQLLARIRRRRFFIPSKAGAPDSLALLKEDRAR
jgi:plasmid stability protein